MTIGSEISGGARNIFAEKCRMDSPRLDRALRFKNNAARGGLIERIAMRDVTVGEVAEAIVAADFFYEEGRNGGYTPILRDVDVRNVTSRKSKHALLLKGFAESPITNVRVTDCRFDGVADADVLEGVHDLVLTNVTVNGKRRDERISRCYSYQLFSAIRAPWIRMLRTGATGRHIRAPRPGKAPRAMMRRRR